MVHIRWKYQKKMEPTGGCESSRALHFFWLGRSCYGVFWKEKATAGSLLPGTS